MVDDVSPPPPLATADTRRKPRPHQVGQKQKGYTRKREDEMEARTDPPP